MITALAPRMPRGYSWVWLSIVLLGVLSGEPQAQEEKSSTEATNKAEAKPATDAAEPAKKDDSADEAAPSEEEKTLSSVEFFVDPNAKLANEVKFPQLPSSPLITAPQIREVEAMAKGGSIDRALIQKYVNKFTADLTNHTYIKGLIDPQPGTPPTSSTAVGFREASANLSNPINLAKRANNAAFLKVYTEALLVQAPKLLKNHLLARIETAILLGKTGSPEAVDTFIAQLNDKDQTVWVKVWAARGLLNVLQTSTGVYQDLPGGTTVIAKSAHALVDLLSDKTLPWPAQLRAVEALGALRMAADPRAQGKLEMATSAMEILADPKVRPEVRAQAAWALGMMRANQANTKFNYKLIAYQAGEVTAELADKIVATYPVNLSLARTYAAPLFYQIYPAFYGVEGARESGLLRMPSLGANRVYVDQIANLIKPVAKSAVELFKAPPGAREKLAKELSDRSAALKSFLEKNVPEDTQFGEKTFPLKAEIAGVRPGQPKVAGTVNVR